MDQSTGPSLKTRHVRKVCHITTVHPADDHRILHKECASLVAAGYEVILIAPHERRERLLGVNVIPLAAGARSHLLRMAKRSFSAYRLAVGLDADLYHFHDPDFLPYAVLLARSGKPVIYDAHEDVPRQILEKHWIWPRLRRPTAWLVGAIEAASVKRLSAVICVTPPMLDRFRAISKRVEVVANFPRLDEITPAPWEAKPRLICCVGGISEVRGTPEMVDAMVDVDAELVLAGSPSPASLLDSLQSRPGWQRVRYLGRIGRQEISQVLDQARIGLLPLHPSPNHLVSYPVKLFEYMSAGIPVVATDVQPWADLIATHRCGICVPPGNPTALATAVTKLLDDPHEAQAMGRRGRLAAEQTYSWESEATKMLALYEAAQ